MDEKNVNQVPQPAQPVTPGEPAQPAQPVTPGEPAQPTYGGSDAACGAARSAYGGSDAAG